MDLNGSEGRWKWPLCSLEDYLKKHEHKKRIINNFKASILFLSESWDAADPELLADSTVTAKLAAHDQWDV